MEKKKVWVFTAQQVYNCETLDLIKEVLYNNEDSIDYIKPFVEEAKEDLKTNGWQVDEDCETWFVSFEPFRYPENHVEFSVDEKEIR